MSKRNLVSLIVCAVFATAITFAWTVSQQPSTHASVLSAQSTNNVLIAQSTSFTQTSGNLNANQPQEEQGSCSYPCWLYNGDEFGCMRAQAWTSKCGWCEKHKSCLIDKVEFCN